MGAIKDYPSVFGGSVVNSTDHRTVQNGVTLLRRTRDLIGRIGHAPYDAMLSKKPQLEDAFYRLLVSRGSMICHDHSRLRR